MAISLKNLHLLKQRQFFQILSSKMFFISSSLEWLQTEEILTSWNSFSDVVFTLIYSGKQSTCFLFGEVQFINEISNEWRIFCTRNERNIWRIRWASNNRESYYLTIQLIKTRIDMNFLGNERRARASETEVINDAFERGWASGLTKYLVRDRINGASWWRILNASSIRNSTNTSRKNVWDLVNHRTSGLSITFLIIHVTFVFAKLTIDRRNRNKQLDDRISDRKIKNDSSWYFKISLLRSFILMNHNFLTTRLLNQFGYKFTFDTL